MADEEMKTALIHIKRHIYSKPIKKYIDTLLEGYKKSVQKNLYSSAIVYRQVYEMPLYGLKKGVYDDSI